MRRIRTLLTGGTSRTLAITMVSFLMFGCPIGEQGTRPTSNGYVGGQIAMRKWLGFAASQPIYENDIRDRFLELYPIGTSISKVRTDAATAGLVEGLPANDVSPGFPPQGFSQRHTVFSDPDLAFPVFLVPAGDFQVFVGLDADDNIVDIVVFDHEGLGP